MKKMIWGLFALACVSCSTSPADGNYKLDIYATNDVHGRFFDSLYVGNTTKESLLAVSAEIEKAREENGKIVLLDAGDALQGDNASYYFNFIDTTSVHIFSRLAQYLGYDALCVGNHDVETGHKVYDRFKQSTPIPYLAANTPRTDNGKPYFQPYVILEKKGLRIAVIGFTNANIKNWIAPSLYEGMDFLPIKDCAQEIVDRVIRKEKPQVIIVLTHTGTGEGDGSQLESEGRDLLSSLHGVDFLICSHDHRACAEHNDGLWLLNAGSQCRYLSHGTVELEIKGGKVVSRKTVGEIIPVDKTKTDERMRREFSSEYNLVKAFTLQPVGVIAEDIYTKDSYTGMSAYMNLLHTVCLESSGADISIAAPLTFNARIPSGTVVFNDLFTIYPFENLLYLVRMSGKEIKDYLEYSYDQWINTYPGKSEFLLKIEKRSDGRYSFVNRSYNFDSAAGICYKLDVTKEAGESVSISSMADGSVFSLEKDYLVSMTSYRACGGGGLLSDGAGIKDCEERIVGRFPEIRDLIYDYFKQHPNVNPEHTEGLGYWSFEPYDLASRAIASDMKLMFGE